MFNIKIFKTDNEVTSSDGKTWDDVCIEDKIYQKDMGVPVEESSFYVKNKPYENIPEAGSIATFTEIEDKSMAVQQDYSRNHVEFGEWVKRNPNKYLFNSYIKLLFDFKAILHFKSNIAFKMKHKKQHITTSKSPIKSE